MGRPYHAINLAVAHCTALPPLTWAMVGRLGGALALGGCCSCAALPIGVGAGARPAPPGRALSGEGAAGVVGWTGEGVESPRSPPDSPAPEAAAFPGREDEGGAGAAPRTRACSVGSRVDRAGEVEACWRGADRAGTVCHSPAWGGMDVVGVGVWEWVGEVEGEGRRDAQEKEKWTRERGKIGSPHSPPHSHTPPSPDMLPVLLALLLAASAGRPAAAGTTTVDLYRNNAVLDNLGGKERPAKNVAVRFFF